MKNSIDFRQWQEQQIAAREAVRSEMVQKFCAFMSEFCQGIDYSMKVEVARFSGKFSIYSRIGAFRVQMNEEDMIVRVINTERVIDLRGVEVGA